MLRAMPDQPRSPLRLLHQLARSGGTVISRCLACMTGVALLSEVHARATGFVNPLAQAQAWFAPFGQSEWEALCASGPLSFAEAIAAIEPALRRQRLALVLREWSHLDFTGVPVIADPPLRSITAEELAGRFELIRLATVRHPLDQFLSASVVPSLRGRLEINRYFLGYRRFAEMAVSLGFVRFEDFCENPAATMRRSCGVLALPFDPTFEQRQAGWTKITGDHAIGGSRGGGSPQPLPRRACADDMLARIAGNADYRASLELLGYHHPERGLSPAGTDRRREPCTCSS